MSSFTRNKLDICIKTNYLCAMTIAEKIRIKILSIPDESTFGYRDLCIANEEFQATAKALERLQKKGIIKKLSKGVFYKPIETIFGEIKPNFNEQLKSYLFRNGVRVAYVTGTSLYNELGLTTQMAFRIKIASRGHRISINKGAIKANAVKSYVDVSEDNYQLLGFLDAIKDIKIIPDTKVLNTLKILSNKIKNLTDSQIIEMVKYADYYPPRVRALLGYILENIDSKIETKSLKDSLNPLTTINIGLNNSEKVSAKNWNLV